MNKDGVDDEDPMSFRKELTCFVTIQTLVDMTNKAVRIERQRPKSYQTRDQVHDLVIIVEKDQFPCNLRLKSFKGSCLIHTTVEGS